ncbi:MAG TPA: hypothetical protein VFL91_21120 [Thermomicrobiales bacterium]|nr:hypothetical protein [Thermomicrobiales bacterium]
MPALTGRLRSAWREHRPHLPGGPEARSQAPAHPALPFRAVERLLSLYVAGLTDGALVVAERQDAAAGAYTDGRAIFLPGELAAFPARAGNVLLYKVLTAHAAAQVLYGSLEPGPDLELLRAAPDPDLAHRLYSIVEGARLAARLAADFPGLGRDLAVLGAEALARRPRAASLAPRARALEAAIRWALGDGADVPEQVAARLAALPENGDLATSTRPEVVARIGELVAALANLRAGEEPPPPFGRSRIRLDRVYVEPPEPVGLPEPPRPPHRPHRADLLPAPRPALVVEGQGPPPALPNEERRADPGGSRQVAVSYADTLPQFTARLVPLTAEEKRGAFVYPEWDAALGAYRPEWCALRPRRLGAASADYVERVLRRHHAQVQALKKQFETLRPERQRLRRQDDGDDLDLDAAVESHVDRRLGLPPAERPYMRVREQRRDIAVAFLIDLSGSTGGYIGGVRGGERVIDVEKQSLALLCEALSVLDDRYAIYGFSGSTRKGCEFYTVKDFADAYDDGAKRRLSGLIPLSYTRLGPPVRHATRLLQEVNAKVRLLMLLSDGRPNDFDAYGGEYGVEDTRKALLEARGHGVRTFCLTIDAEARDYMPRLFGAGNYVTLARVEALPRTLPDLYRRLTVG